MVTRQEYEATLEKVYAPKLGKEVPNYPFVACDKHYFVDGKPEGKFYRCEMAEDGWKCPHCGEVYKYEKFMEK